MWRMQRANGLSSHAVIIPRPHGAIFAWFLNGRALGFKHLDDWTSAIHCSDQMQAQNWAIGWRLASDDNDARTDS